MANPGGGGGGGGGGGRICPVRDCPGPAQPDDPLHWFEHERAHQSQPPTGLTCFLCPVVKTFDTAAALEEHRALAHTNDPQWHLAQW